MRKPQRPALEQRGPVSEETPSLTRGCSGLRRAGPTGLGSEAMGACGEGHSWGDNGQRSLLLLPLALPPTQLSLVGSVKSGLSTTLKMHPNLGGKEEAPGATGWGKLPSSFSTGLSLSRPKWCLREGPAGGHGQAPGRQ